MILAVLTYFREKTQITGSNWLVLEKAAVSSSANAPSQTLTFTSAHDLYSFWKEKAKESENQTLLPK